MATPARSAPAPDFKIPSIAGPSDQRPMEFRLHNLAEKLQVFAREKYGIELTIDEAVHELEMRKDK